MRQRDAGEFFVGAYAGEDLVGFVCGTCCEGEELADETMSTHSVAPGATTLCVHSVVVAEEHRRQGVATRMLQSYVNRVQDRAPKVQRIMLIAKVHLLEFYTRSGFCVTRLSPVVHGADPWIEMKLQPGLPQRRLERRSLPLIQVDAFALPAPAGGPDGLIPFTGNPAAVVVMDACGAGGAAAPQDPGHKLPAAGGPLGVWMQRVAVENNLSETAFVWPSHAETESGPEGAARAHTFGLRWFTPGCEVDLCGHATLATAFALWYRGDAPPDAPLHFVSRSGELTATLGPPPAGANPGGIVGRRVLLDFPSEPPRIAPDGAAVRAQLLVALWPGLDDAALCAAHDGAAPLLAVYRNRVDVFARLTPLAFDKLLGCRPDLVALAKVESRGVVITREGGEGGVDFSSRFFGPNCGVDEDPVTGSAHCGLCPLWAHELGLVDGATGDTTRPLVGRQCSARGGNVRVRLTDGGARVELAGAAIVTVEGRLMSKPN
eukprot:g3217.t1